MHRIIKQKFICMVEKSLRWFKLFGHFSYGWRVVFAFCIVDKVYILDHCAMAMWLCATSQLCKQKWMKNNVNTGNTETLSHFKDSHTISTFPECTKNDDTQQTPTQRTPTQQDEPNILLQNTMKFIDISFYESQTFCFPHSHPPAPPRFDNFN